MGTPAMTSSSSLDRLKALDALPNLASQLQEAKQLCDHRARAEMILKWLMGKLKTSEEAQQNDSSWILLASTVRLVPAQRLAVLCSGLLSAFQQTWAALDLSDDTICATVRLFNILLEVGKGTDGAAVRSMLSVKGDTAATMCGHWYRHIHHNFSKEGEMEILMEETLLGPALQLWELRKHMEDDDTSFNTHCLVPILLLLARLRNSNSITSVKRKRGHDIGNFTQVRSYEHNLEALVARHTVLPARVVFNRKHEQQPRRMVPGQQKAVQPTIKDRLSALKGAIASGKADGSTIESLWLVLDVAMRSVSTPTPRHRFAERPWIEAVFVALSDCATDQSRQVINGTLIDLLDTVRRNGAGHTALSAQTLTNLLKRQAIPEATRDEVMDWQLVAKIVELEPDVLTNTTLTEELFEAINDTRDHQPSISITLLRDGIIVPTMEAFARSRGLSSFVDIWHKQLLRPRLTQEPSVWESLSAPFAEILEEYMLSDQIISQIDRRYLPVSAAVEDQSKLSNEGVASALTANIVLLKSLLSGVRSDDLVLRIQDKLDALLHTSLDLANLKSFKTTIATSCHYWGLLTRAFQIWYPFWATKQDGVAEVEREGMALLSSKAFKYALAEGSALATDGTPNHSAQTPRAARTFVASLCVCFQQYGGQEGCAGQCEKAMARVVKQDADAASVLVRRQALFASLDAEIRKELVSSSLVSVGDAGSEARSAASPLEALLASSHSKGEQQVNEDAVSVIVGKLSDMKGGVSEKALITTLMNMDPHSIEQTQRVKILDMVSQLPGMQADQDGAALIQARLALLLKLLSISSQNSRLLTEPGRIWELASSLKPTIKAAVMADFSSQLDSVANVQLLEDIIRCLFKSLLTTQDSSKSQKALVEISQLIKDAVKQGAKSMKLSTHLGQLAFIKVAITMLEASVKEEIKSQLVYRASKTAKSYLDALMAECLAYSNEKGARLSTVQGKSVLSALQALLDAPSSLFELSGIGEAEHAKELSRLARDLMLPVRIPEDPVLQSRLLTVCFQMICKYAPGKKNLTTVAENVVERDLKARDLVRVLLAYEEAFKQADVEWKLTAITALTSDRSVQQYSVILLRQSILKALTKEDSEAMPSAKDIVLHTLQAATSPGTALIVRRLALQSLALICKDKAFLTTQYTIEQTLSSLQGILSSDVSLDVGVLYLDICNVLTVILAHHRSRLQGRFHLLVGVLQQLMSHLFSDERAEVHQARSLAKLLESFCSPPAPRYRKGGKQSELVDEAKKAQAHAGQFAQYLLHFYCSCVLTGSLGEGVREALLSGVWAIIQAMEAYNEEGIKVLSSAANNSERAVLRTVYEDWKRFGKWEGV